MATSYPDRTNARGIWKLSNITKNIKTEGTWPRGSTRGLFGGGTDSGYVNTVDYANVETTGNATDFGDLTSVKNQNSGRGSFIRAVFGGGYATPAATNVIDYANPISTGNFSDFGNLTAARRGLGSSGNNIRGLFAGGQPSTTNIIDYIIFTSLGNAVDFGDLTVTGMGFNNSQCNSSTRGLFAGSNTPANLNTIDFVEIATTGNAVDFGDSTLARTQSGGICSSTRGILAGGYTTGESDVIDYITIAGKGNATDFGDLSSGTQHPGCASSLTRGVISSVGTGNVTIEYITIASAGDAADFGDLNFAPSQGSGCSNGHGGLDVVDPDLRFLVTGNRMLIAAGETPTFLDSIEKIEINSLGNATDFGDMTSARTYPCSPNNTTRGLIYSGYTGSYVNTIDQVNMRSLGNAADFGDSTYHTSSNGGAASHTRSIAAGGVGNPGSGVTVWDIIEYNTFATAGNATDFGDLLDVNRSPTGGSCNSTRGVFAGGLPQDSGAGVLNVMQYVTMASTGDASDFGDLSVARSKPSVGGGGISSATRGVFACGNAPSRSNVMDYITTASTGNATDFGDATVVRRGGAAGSSGVRGIIAAGDTPTVISSIDYITIASTGDAADFGDTATARMFPTGMAQGHGGLSS